MLAFINAVGAYLRERADWVVILAGMALILSFIEMRLRSLFASHEVRESNLHASAQLVAESASGATRVISGHIDELRAKTAATDLTVADQGRKVESLAYRVEEIDKRLARAAGAVPRTHRREGDPQ